jgi:hypothetical protein
MNNKSRLITVALIVATSLLVSSAGGGRVLEISPATPILVGQSIQFFASGAGGSVKWSSDNAAIASVTASGLVTGKAPGLTTIRARAGNQRAYTVVQVIAGEPPPPPPPPPPGDTITAASCALPDVQAAINAAVDSNTVVIPAGTCTWASSLVITGKILVIKGAGIDQTVIVDGVSKETWPNVPQVLAYATKPGGLTRITGLTFQGGTITDPNNKGMVLISGNSDQFRMDHVRIITTTTSGVFFSGNVRGVVDSSVFTINSWHIGIYVFHESWNNTGDFGDASFADDSHFGTDRAIFVEDNTFTSINGAPAIDGWSGSRVVFRHNTLMNTAFANHGTETGGRWRGQRTFEVYDNTITFTQWQWPNMVGMRGGTGVVFNNAGTYTGNGYAHDVTEVTAYRYSDRSRTYTPWGFCDGSNVWDGNQESTGYPCLDQPGRGRGTLLSGYDPTPIGWTAQALDPVYAWSNTLNGQPSPMVSTAGVVMDGRDFINAVKPNYTPYTYPHPLRAN